MPPVCPQRSASPEQLVHVARNPNRYAAHAARQRPFVRRFDHEVHVVVLHGEVQHPKPFRITPRRSDQGQPNRWKYVLAAERCQTSAQRNVDWLVRAVTRPSHMRDVPARSALPPRSLPGAAPPGGKRERQLLRAPLRFARMPARARARPAARTCDTRSTCPQPTPVRHLAHSHSDRCPNVNPRQIRSEYFAPSHSARRRLKALPCVDSRTRSPSRSMSALDTRGHASRCFVATRRVEPTSHEGVASPACGPSQRRSGSGRADPADG
jgi:hypothetical protein